MQTTKMPKLNREEFNVYLENIPIGEEAKQFIKEHAKILYDFDDFLCKKFNTSIYAVNAILDTNINIMLKNRIEENPNLASTEDEIFKLLGEVCSDYAKSVGFSDYEKIAKSNVEIINALAKSI